MIDAELSQLKQARTLLSSTTDVLAKISTRGRPKGSSNAVKEPAVASKPKRTMNEAARKAVGDAARKRHAAKKKATRKAANEEPMPV